MKVLYSWLQEFVQTDWSAQKAAEAFERAGFSIAHVGPLTKPFSHVVVAEVLKAEKHPNADKLSLCEVSDGTSTYTIVCGAANVRSGLRVALAKIGAILPNGLEIKKAKIRGIESSGMLCGKSELGLEEKSDGIWELPKDYPLGAEVFSASGLDDYLLEIEVTPNRRDGLSVIGLARELSIASGCQLKIPEPRAREIEVAPLTISNIAPDACFRYIGRLIRQVRVAPSPKWMSSRLEAAGIRSINNLVDITNYVLLECGQPLHVFDWQKLLGGKLIVRYALPGETLEALDEKTYSLRSDELVIADEKKPVAIAGVMGGQYSGVTDTTSDVILESAYFRADLVRKQRKRLNLTSESSYRFERGTDWNMVDYASRRAAQLIQELAGGVRYKPVDLSEPRSEKPPIVLRTSRVKDYLGIDFKGAALAEQMRRLGCTIVIGHEQMHVTPPSWRLDLTQEVDLIEEVARIHGYDQIPVTIPNVRISEIPHDARLEFQNNLLKAMIGVGFSEAYNFSYVGKQWTDFYSPALGFSTDHTAIALANPLSNDQVYLRTSLLENLTRNLIENQRNGNESVQLVERGRIYLQDKSGITEHPRIGFIMSGQRQSKNWHGEELSYSYFDGSGLIESLSKHFALPTGNWMPLHHPLFHPKRAAAYVVQGRVLAWVGEFHPLLLRKLDTKKTIIGGELDVEQWFSCLPRSTPYRPIKRFSPVTRDLSFVLDESITYEMLINVIRQAGAKILEQVQLIDIYRDARIGTSKKSMTLTLTFMGIDKTLVDSEIEASIQKIIQETQTKLGGELRK